MTKRLWLRNAVLAVVSLLVGEFFGAIGFFITTAYARSGVLISVWNFDFDLVAFRSFVIFPACVVAFGLWLFAGTEQQGNNTAENPDK